MDLISKLKIFQTIPLFSTLSSADASAFAAITEEKEFSAGESLVRQAEATHAAYIIIEGFIKIYRTTKEGKNVWLAMVGPGALVGELGLFDDNVRSATVEAMQPMKTLMVQQPHFIHFLSNHPHVSLVVLKYLANRIRIMNQRLENITSRSLTERTELALRFLESFYPNGEINLSHEQLAEMLGATRPRVSEILEKLQTNHVIAMNNRSITLLR